MIHLNKKLVHEYVDDWFNNNLTTTINDWEKDVLNEIFLYYAGNELECVDFDHKKLVNFITNDPLYVKNYKHWLEQTALNRIKDDF